MFHRTTRRSTVVVATLLMAGGAIAPASASAAEANTACDTEFAALVQATEDASFTSRRAAQDQQGLIDKAYMAQSKFQINKVADSLQKLDDYSTKVTTLASTGKVADASGMLAAHAAAVECVSS